MVQFIRGKSLAIGLKRPIDYCTMGNGKSWGLGICVGEYFYYVMLDWS